MNGVSFRAALVGLLGAVVLCAATYYNDYVIKQTFLIGHFLPVAVYGAVLLALLTLQPLWARFLPRSAPRGAEYAVVLSLVLAVCAIPSSGFLRTFGAAIILPHQYERTQSGWREGQIVEQVPRQLLADAEAEDGRAVSGFVQSLASGQERVGMAELPWQALQGPLLFWLPLLGCIAMALLGLSLVMHRQWSQHEHLPYPIAQIFNALLPNSEEPGKSLLRQPGLLIVGGAVLAIHLLNWSHTQFQWFLPVPLDVQLRTLTSGLPAPLRDGNFYALNFHLYFSAIGVAMLLPRDVSLSIGIGPLLFGLCAGLLAMSGVGIGGDESSPQNFMLFGSMSGLVAVMLYTGRHFYVRVLGRALFLPSKSLPDEKEMGRSPVWGARLFLVAGTGAVLMMAAVGLDWPFALLFFLMLLVVWLAMSRILAETGLFYIEPVLSPAALMLGFFGPRALGPEIVLLLGLFTLILMANPREALMPFLVQSLQSSSLQEVKPGGVAMLCVMALVLGVAVALPLTFYFQYNGGIANVDSWSADRVKRPFEQALLVQQRLESQGTLELARESSGWARMRLIRANSASVLAFCAGLGLTLLFSFCRLRVPGWPLHPVLFATWFGYSIEQFALCFLIGFVVKSAVMHYGGDMAVRKLKPLAAGLVAGEVLGAFICVALSILYTAVTGEVPRRFMVMPG